MVARRWLVLYAVFSVGLVLIWLAFQLRLSTAATALPPAADGGCVVTRALGVEKRTCDASATVNLIPSPSHAESVSRATAAPVGISGSTATELARAHVLDSAVFVSAVAGRYRDVFTIRSAGVALNQPDRLVWAVTFDAAIAICPPAGTPCWKPRPGQTQVILDYVTGETLESFTFSPRQ
jgi:hypothetical protein